MDSTATNQTSTPEAKIALFRSLFRGREDVYPRRFENRKTGKAGYAPACANEWIRKRDRNSFILASGGESFVTGKAPVISSAPVLRSIPDFNGSIFFPAPK